MSEDKSSCAEQTRDSTAASVLGAATREKAELSLKEPTNSPTKKCWPSCDGESNANTQIPDEPLADGKNGRDNRFIA